MRRWLAILLLGVVGARAQSPAASTPETSPETTTLSATSTLVRVPVMVTTKSGEPVFTLKAGDFHVTDDTAPQQVTLDDETGSQPLALVLLIQTGGAGARHLDDLRKLPVLLDTIVGNVKRRVAIVTFDSTPAVLQDFTADTEAVGAAFNDLQSGDEHAATLDALTFSVALLGRQPLEYRRAILLVSETVDHGSHVGLEAALRAIGDTNTTIYSIAFHSARAAGTHEASKLLNGPPGPAHGCFSQETQEEDLASDTSDNRFVQAYDCLSLLAPPLRLVKIATLLAMDNLRRNVPESVARQTGGEYLVFNNTKDVERGLVAISNHLPNQYVLSFHPQAPHPGLHAIGLTLPEYPQLKVTARSNYWADAGSTPPAQP